MSKRITNGVLAGAAALLAAIGLPSVSAGLDVALTLEETAGVTRVQDACRTGIPLAPGSLTDEKTLRLLDVKGAEVPGQFRVISRRDKGDIAWVCVDFLADVPARGKVVYRLTDSRPAKPVDKPLTVTESAEEIALVSRPLKLVVSRKSFAGLGEVWLDRAIGFVPSGGIQEHPAARGHGLHADRQVGRVGRSRGGVHLRH